MTRLSICAVPMILWASMALAQSDVMSGSYACGDGVTIPAVFITPASGESHAVVLIEGELVFMRVVVSASGARFRGDGGADAWELWTKGDSATLAQGAQGQERVRYQDCLWQQ